MGDPIEIRLRGSSLSIRGTEAAGIDVEFLPSESLDAVLSPAE
jgi:Fe2+ transport system protein FeoA